MGLNAAGDTYEDGDFDTAEPTEYPVTSYPFFDRGDNATRVVTQEFVVRGDSYRPGIPGSRYPFAGLIYDPRSFYLVDESVPSNDHGYFKFTRTWSQIPRTRDEGESYVYTNVSPTKFLSFYYFNSVTKKVNSILRYSYIYTATSYTQKLDVAYKILIHTDQLGNQTLKYIGLKKGNLVLADDAVMRRWRGNIWEIESRFVDLRAFDDKVDTIVTGSS